MGVGWEGGHGSEEDFGSFVVVYRARESLEGGIKDQLLWRKGWWGAEKLWVGEGVKGWKVVPKSREDVWRILGSAPCGEALVVDWLE